MCTSCKKFMNDQLLTLNKEVCHENWKCIYRKKCNLTLTNNLDLHNVLIIIESGSLYHWIQHPKLYMWGKSHALIIFWKLPLILATKQLDYYFLPISPLLCWQKTPKQTRNPNTWWRHQMETFSALLAICAGNSPVPGEFPAQRPVTRSFDFFFICARINGWVNNGKAGDLRRNHAHYDVTVMKNGELHALVCPSSIPTQTPVKTQRKILNETPVYLFFIKWWLNKLRIRYPNCIFWKSSFP